MVILYLETYERCRMWSSLTPFIPMGLLDCPSQPFWLWAVVVHLWFSCRLQAVAAAIKASRVGGIRIQSCFLRNQIISSFIQHLQPFGWDTKLMHSALPLSSNTLLSISVWWFGSPPAMPSHTPTGCSPATVALRYNATPSLLPLVVEHLLHLRQETQKT